MSQILHGTYLHLKVYVSDLKFKCNWVFCNLPGNPNCKIKPEYPICMGPASGWGTEKVPA